MIPQPCRHFALQGIAVWNPPVQAVARKHAELRLGHVEPRAVFGGVVNLQLSAMRFGRAVDLARDAVLLGFADQGRVQAVFDETLAHPLHRASADVEGLCNPLVFPAVAIGADIGFQEDPGMKPFLRSGLPLGHSGIVEACGDFGR